MLSKEHKSELFAWISSRIHWLKVVLIGNRSNGKGRIIVANLFQELDDELISRMQKEKAQNVFIKKYSCRLSVKKVLDICKDNKGINDGSTLDFIKNWCVAARGLFSDDVLTLRLVDQLQKNYSNKSLQVHLLSEMLLDKMPTLGPFTCR